MPFSPVRAFPVRSARKSLADPHETLNIFTDKGKTQDLLTGSRLGKTQSSGALHSESNNIFGKENDAKRQIPRSDSRGKERKGVPTDSIGLEKNKQAINLFQTGSDDTKRESRPAIGRKRHSISGPIAQEEPRAQRKGTVPEPSASDAPRHQRKGSIHSHRASLSSMTDVFRGAPEDNQPKPVQRRPSTSSLHTASTALPQGGKFVDTRSEDVSKKPVRRRSQVLPVGRNSVDYNILNPTPSVTNTYRRQKGPVPAHARSLSTPPRAPRPQSAARAPTPARSHAQPPTSNATSTAVDSNNPIAWHI